MFQQAMKYAGVLILPLSISIFAQDINGDSQVYQEYREISQRLQELQLAALSDLEIAKQAEEFSKNLERAMIEEDSSIIEKLNRKDDIVDQYENTEKQGNETEMLKLQQEFNHITQDLLVHQRNVLEKNNEIKEEGENLEKALFEKMKQLDPEVPVLISRLESLGNQIRGYEEDKRL